MNNNILHYDKFWSPLAKRLKICIIYVAKGSSGTEGARNRKKIADEVGTCYVPLKMLLNTLENYKEGIYTTGPGGAKEIYMIYI